MPTIRRDPRARPPDSVRQLFKTLRQRDVLATETIPRRSGTTPESDHVTTSCCTVEHIVSENHSQVMFEFCEAEDLKAIHRPSLPRHEPGIAYEVASLPGMSYLHHCSAHLADFSQDSTCYLHFYPQRLR